MSLSTPVPDIVDQSTDPLLGTHPSWSRIPLHKVARVQNGFPFPSSAFVSGNPEAGMPLIRIRDVMRHRTDTTFIGAFDPAYVVEPGSLLIGMDGDFNTAMWKGPPALLNQRVCRVTTDEQAYSTKFLSYVLPGYLAAINAATSSITVKHLSSKAVEAIPLPLPPLPEQHRIVAAIETHLTRLDAAVAALERARARLKRYRAAVLKAACEGRLVPTEAHLARTEGRPYEPAPAHLARIQSARATAGPVVGRRRQPTLALPPDDRLETPALPDLPEGWTWTSVGDVRSSEPNSITDGPFGSNLKTEHYTDAGPRVIRLQNVGDGRFVDAMAHITADHFERLAKHHIAAGDIVIAALGETLPRACVIPDNTGPALVKADCIRLQPENALTSSAFLNIVLNAEPTRLRVTAAVHGVGRPRLNLGEVKAIAIPLPPLAEQERIVAEVERRLSVLDQLDAAVTANLKRADALRQSVLRRAFAGHLVPTGDHTT